METHSLCSYKWKPGKYSYNSFSRENSPGACWRRRRVHDILMPASSASSASSMWLPVNPSVDSRTGSRDATATLSQRGPTALTGQVETGTRMYWLADPMGWSVLDLDPV